MTHQGGWLQKTARTDLPNKVPASVKTINQLQTHIEGEYLIKEQRPRIRDTHKRVSFLLEKSLIERLDRIAFNRNGFKTLLFNQAMEGILKHFETGKQLVIDLPAEANGVPDDEHFWLVENAQQQEIIMRPVLKETHKPVTFLLDKRIIERLDDIAAGRRGFKITAYNLAMEAVLRDYEAGQFAAYEVMGQ